MFGIGSIRLVDSNARPFTLLSPFRLPALYHARFRAWLAGGEERANGILQKLNAAALDFLRSHRRKQPTNQELTAGVSRR